MAEPQSMEAQDGFPIMNPNLYDALGNPKESSGDSIYDDAIQEATLVSEGLKYTSIGYIFE
jgi:hypothetical protein